MKKRLKKLTAEKYAEIKKSRGDLATAAKTHGVSETTVKRVRTTENYDQYINRNRDRAMSQKSDKKKDKKSLNCPHSRFQIDDLIFYFDEGEVNVARVLRVRAELFYSKDGVVEKQITYITPGGCFSESRVYKDKEEMLAGVTKKIETAFAAMGK